MWTGSASRSLGAGQTLRALRTLWPLRSSSALGALRTLGAGNSRRALRSGGPHFTGRTGLTFRTDRAYGALGTFSSLGALLGRGTGGENDDEREESLSHGRNMAGARARGN